MRSTQIFKTENPAQFKQKALYWASGFNSVCYLDSNSFRDDYHEADGMLFAGAQETLSAQAGNVLEQLSHFIKDKEVFLPGFISYDLKNEIEQLQSNNPDGLGFPDLYFFVPQHQIIIRNDSVEIQSEHPLQVFESIQKTDLPAAHLGFKGKIEQKINREDYLQNIIKLQEHIKRGDIYEVNFCQEFYAKEAELNPLAAFIELNKISPTPFANFFKMGEKYIISATPERFLCRRGNELISQPIKGTASRNADQQADEKAKQDLRQSEKERSENVMIVDLVRNDLTRCAIPGTVKVKELFGIYSFEQVHQMISTVCCKVEAETKVADILKSTFPMGSMTGAPKIKAMQLIEKYEQSKRGVYSGSVGYISPNGDFDFNVIIRTLLYNAETKYVSYQVGSAITYQSNPEKEYEECLLKAKAIMQLLGK